MDGRNRSTGITDALGKVLAKLNGNPDLAKDSHTGAFESTPPNLVANFAYLDRMPNDPKQHEQGSRDRPYDPSVRFDEAAIETILSTWNQTPWPAATRPSVNIAITISPRKGKPFPLQADTLIAEQRPAALIDAADRKAFPIALPASDTAPPSCCKAR